VCYNCNSYGKFGYCNKQGYTRLPGIFGQEVEEEVKNGDIQNGGATNT